MTSQGPRAALIGALLAGCGGGTGAKGELGGEKIAVTDAFYTQEAGAWPDGDRIRVFVSGYGDACEKRASYLADLENDETPEDLAASWKAAMPRAFWWVEIDLRLDAGASATGDYAGQPWDDELAASGQAQAAFFHYLQPLDVRYWDSSADDADYVARFLSDGGTVEVEATEDGLSGEIEAPGVDFEGAPAGDAIVSFQAQRCAAVEES